MLRAALGTDIQSYSWFRELARPFLFRTTRDIKLMLGREQTDREASPTARASWHLTQRPVVTIPAKKIVGCKRRIAVDTDRCLLMINLTPDSIFDSVGAQMSLNAIVSIGQR